jgi:hypothetical protein
MPEVPEEAVRLALAAYAREAYCDGEPIEGDERVIRCALEAAAPVMAEAVAEKITAHKYAHEPKGPLIGGRSAEEQRRRTWRRHLGIAAQVAALAFSTPEDLKREAAGALNRGDYAACWLDEAGRSVAGSREDDDHHE